MKPCPVAGFHIRAGSPAGSNKLVDNHFKVSSVSLLKSGFALSHPSYVLGPSLNPWQLKRCINPLSVLILNIYGSNVEISDTHKCIFSARHCRIKNLVSNTNYLCDQEENKNPYQFRLLWSAWYLLLNNLF